MTTTKKATKSTATTTAGALTLVGSKKDAAPTPIERIADATVNIHDAAVTALEKLDVGIARVVLLGDRAAELGDADTDEREGLAALVEVRHGLETALAEAKHLEAAIRDTASGTYDDPVTLNRRG